MSSKHLHIRHDQLLPLVLGLTDGILTALILTSGTLINPTRHVTISLALRIAISALASSAFVFFVARYSELRTQLVDAERQLNLTSHGQLATGKLGSAVRRQAVIAAVISSVSSFLGALIPLAASVVLPMSRWSGVIVALAALGFLGIGLAKAVFGNAFRWCAVLIVGGICLFLLGVRLKIV